MFMTRRDPPLVGDRDVREDFAADSNLSAASLFASSAPFAFFSFARSPPSASEGWLGLLGFISPARKARRNKDLNPNGLC